MRYHHSFIRYLILVVIAGALGTAAMLQAQTQTIDLHSQWDDRRPLPNPHKGWYHHYPDNHIDIYKIKNDADLTGFPGMDHV
jgi:hypothetical protein